MREAIVGYSFGSENAKSNTDLGKVVDSIHKGKLVVVQHEIAGCIRSRPSLVIRQRSGYLDTEEVTRQAAVFLKKRNVRKVCVVAQPFLHRRKCIGLLKKAGFVVFVPKTGKIRFDSESNQWWTRSRKYFFIYAVLQKLTGRRGR